MTAFASSILSSSASSGAGSTQTPPHARRQQRVQQIGVDPVELRHQIAHVVRRLEVEQDADVTAGDDEIGERHSRSGGMRGESVGEIHRDAS